MRIDSISNATIVKTTSAQDSGDSGSDAANQAAANQAAAAQAAASMQNQGVGVQNEKTATGKDAEAVGGTQDKAVMTDEMLKKAVDQANKTLKPYDRVVERSVHPVTHDIMYVIRDTKTKEVIAEFPPKKIEDMIAKMWELAGLFVNEKV